MRQGKAQSFVSAKTARRIKTKTRHKCISKTVNCLLVVVLIVLLVSLTKLCNCDRNVKVKSLLNSSKLSNNNTNNKENDDDDDKIATLCRTSKYKKSLSCFANSLEQLASLPRSIASLLSIQSSGFDKSSHAGHEASQVQSVKLSIDLQALLANITEDSDEDLVIKYLGDKYLVGEDFNAVIQPNDVKIELLDWHKVCNSTQLSNSNSNSIEKKLIDRWNTIVGVGFALSLSIRLTSSQDIINEASQNDIKLCNLKEIGNLLSVNSYTELASFELNAEPLRLATNEGVSVILDSLLSRKKKKINKREEDDEELNEFGFVVSKLKSLKLNSIIYDNLVNYANLLTFSSIFGLEFLSVENCKLNSFPILKNQISTTTTDSQLSTLSIANNKLSSISTGLFNFNINPKHSLPRDDISKSKNSISADTLDCSAHTYQLPRLNSLDASDNLLEVLTPLDAKLIACVLPNLSQLHLRGNKLYYVHLSLFSLNLNYLHPQSYGYHGNDDFIKNYDSPNTDSVTNNQTFHYAIQKLTNKSNKLEYIDLSRNELEILILFTNTMHPSMSSVGNDSNVRFLDLSNNRLTSVSVKLVSPHYLNTLIFEQHLHSSSIMPRQTDVNEDGDEQVIFDISELDEIFELSSPEASDKLNNISHETNDKANKSKLSVGICDLIVNLDTNNNQQHSSASAGAELIFNDNCISEISNLMFASQNCINLQILRLNKNCLHSFESSEVFLKLSNLQLLDLSDNYLTRLPAFVFASMSELKELNLANNKLNYIHNSILSPLAQLERLFLAGNELKSFQISELFATNSALAFVDLCANSLEKLEQIEANSEYISNRFAGRRTKTLNDEQTTTLKSIKTQRRRIMRTQSQKIDKKLTKRSTKKRSDDIVNYQNRNSNSNALILSKNSLVSVNNMSSKCSSMISQLSIIKLDNNNIAELSLKLGFKELFDCTTKLRILILSKNKIRSIESHLLVSLTQIETINLSQNEIITIQPSSFYLPKQTTSLNLDLNNNKLETLDFKSIFFNNNTSVDDKSQLSNKCDRLSISSLNLNNNKALALKGDMLIEFMQMSSRNLNSLKISSIKTIINIDNNDNYKSTKCHLHDFMELEFDCKSLSTHLSQSTYDLVTATRGDKQIRNLRNCLAFLDILMKTNDISNIRKLILRSNDFALDNEEFRFQELQSLQIIDSTLTDEMLINFILRIGNKDTQRIELKELILSNNQLEYFWPIFESSINTNGNHLLYDLASSIERVDVSRNRIRHLFVTESSSRHQQNSSSVIPEFRQLMKLNLSSNFLTSMIPKQPFACLLKAKKLEILDLSYNKLSHLDENIFACLPRLKILSLSYNKLEYLNNLQFIQTSSLKLLDLSNNNKLHLSIDVSNKSLKIIDYDEQDEEDEEKDNYELEQKDILCKTEQDEYCNNNKDCICQDYSNSLILNSMSLGPKIFSSKLSYLLAKSGAKILELKYNSIRQIEAFAFGNTINNILKKLKLTNNLIDDSTLEEKNAFANLNELVELDMSYNLISSLRNIMTLKLRKLTILKLSYNLINNLNFELLEENCYLTQLSQLYLDRNSVSSLNEKSFRYFNYYLPNLRYLNLQGNYIKTNDMKNILKSINKYWQSKLMLHYNLDESDISHASQLLVSDYKVDNFGGLQVMIDKNINSTTTSAKRLVLRVSNRRFNDNNYSLYINEVSIIDSQSNQLVILKNIVDDEIKFCSLEYRGKAKVCVKYIDKNQTITEYQKCFPILINSYDDYCVSRLNFPIDTNNRTDIDTSTWSTNDKSVDVLRNNLDSDFIITGIDKLKSFWLDLKQIDYLSKVSSIESLASTLGKPENRSLLNTLVVCVSICITCLLLAAFALLSCNRKQVQPKTRNPKLKTQNDESNDCSTLLNNKTKSIDVSELNAKALLRRQTNQQLLSSSSSPIGSFETNDTIQTTIDSSAATATTACQQSSTSSTGTSDLYACSSNTTSNASDKQDQQAPALATVMRMIKSNSATFEQMASNEYQDQSSTLAASRLPHSRTSTFGNNALESMTLSSRQSNTLRSRIRSLQVPSQVYTIAENQANQIRDSNQNLAPQLPRRFSSVNASNNLSSLFVSPNEFRDTSIDTRHIQMQAAASISPSSTLTINDTQATTTPLSQYYEPSSLCHYHQAIATSYSGGNEQQMLIPTLTTTNEQKHYHCTSDAIDSLKQLLIVEESQCNLDDIGLPPPPPSRMIEELEKNDQYYNRYK